MSAAGNATRERALVILAAVRAGARDVATVFAAMQAAHAEGRWPKPTWNGGREEPYYTGVGQLMRTMCGWGWLIADYGTPPFTAGPSAPPSPDTDPEDLLPQEPLRSALLARMAAWEARTGHRVVLGVTEDLQRVVRVGCNRGEAEWKLGLGDTWTRALELAGVAE